MPHIDAATLDAHLADAVEAGAVPGIALVVSDPDGVVYDGRAGHLRADDPDAPAVGPDTIFRLASMTKAMATVAALQLLEQGRLALDTEVQAILPAFAELRVLEGWDGDTPRLREPRRAATVQDLLTHTSGLSYHFSNMDLVHWHERTGSPTVLTGLRAALQAPLVCDPGTRFEYGTNTDWLGLVVEELRGAPLDEVLRTELFEPLGMTDTTFRPTEEQRVRAMAIHARTPDGGFDISPLDLPADPEFAAGGSGAWGTAGDHARFLGALLRGGELDGARILRPETTELMFTDHIAGIEQPDMVRSAVPELTNDVPALPIAQGWGLGLHLRHEEIPGMRAAGSADWAGLFNCYFWVDRASGLSASLLTQVLPFFDAGVVGTLLGIEQTLYAAAPAPA